MKVFLTVTQMHNMVLNIDMYLWEEYKFKSRVNFLKPYFWFHVNHSNIFIKGKEIIG